MLRTVRLPNHLSNGWRFEEDGDLAARPFSSSSPAAAAARMTTTLKSLQGESSTSGGSRGGRNGRGHKANTTSSEAVQSYQMRLRQSGESVVLMAVAVPEAGTAEAAIFQQTTAEDDEEREFLAAHVHKNTRRTHSPADGEAGEESATTNANRTVKMAISLSEVRAIVGLPAGAQENAGGTPFDELTGDSVRNPSILEWPTYLGYWMAGWVGWMERSAPYQLQ
jgi:hypothetical protein